MSRVSFQIAAIVFFTFTLFFVWDFSQRILTNVRLAQTEQRLEQQVGKADATHAALVEIKKNVQTDAYIEEKVRRDWRWAREGDKVIVPQITPAPTAAPNVAQPAPLPEKPWWEDWFDFLFGP
jgi:cell division protein FtsB